MFSNPKFPKNKMSTKLIYVSNDNGLYIKLQSEMRASLSELRAEIQRTEDKHIGTMQDAHDKQVCGYYKDTNFDILTTNKNLYAQRTLTSSEVLFGTPQ